MFCNLLVVVDLSSTIFNVFNIFSVSRNNGFFGDCHIHGGSGYLVPDLNHILPPPEVNMSRGFSDDS